MPAKERRVGVAINKGAAEALYKAQDAFELQIGFKPSLSQVIEYLARQYADSQDKLTGGQNVESN